MIRQIAAVLLGAALLAGPTAAQASEEAVTLDSEARQALAALPLLRGPGEAAEALQGRIVVVTFFASWCPPCHVEFDHLNSLRDRYGAEQVAILAVNIFEDFLPRPGGLDGFLADKAPGFTVLGEGEAVAARFGDVKRIPTLFVFGADGAPLYRFIHAEGAKKTHASLEEITAAVEAGL